MKLLRDKNLTIKIAGDPTKVLSMFLRIFLANERLTDKQLEVTTALVRRYSEYVANNVEEPYASIILFSTETRKEICTELEISPAHLNNTFNALTAKNIVAKEGSKYLINPGIVPSSSLTFEFKIDAK